MILFLKQQGLIRTINIENQLFIELNFNEDPGIISNCTGDLKEVLIIFEEENKLVSTWNACDGPGLEYQRGMEFCGTK